MLVDTPPPRLGGVAHRRCDRRFHEAAPIATRRSRSTSCARGRAGATTSRARRRLRRRRRRPREGARTRARPARRRRRARAAPPGSVGPPRELPATPGSARAGRGGSRSPTPRVLRTTPGLPDIGTGATRAPRSSRRRRATTGRAGGFGLARPLPRAQPPRRGRSRPRARGRGGGGAARRRRRRAPSTPARRARAARRAAAPTRRAAPPTTPRRRAGRGAARRDVPSLTKAIDTESMFTRDTLGIATSHTAEFVAMKERQRLRLEEEKPAEQQAALFGDGQGGGGLTGLARLKNLMKGRWSTLPQGVDKKMMTGPARSQAAYGAQGGGPMTGAAEARVALAVAERGRHRVARGMRARAAPASTTTSRRRSAAPRSRSSSSSDRRGRRRRHRRRRGRRGAALLRARRRSQQLDELDQRSTRTARAGVGVAEFNDDVLDPKMHAKVDELAIAGALMPVPLWMITYRRRASAAITEIATSEARRRQPSDRHVRAGRDHAGAARDRRRARAEARAPAPPQQKRSLLDAASNPVLGEARPADQDAAARAAPRAAAQAACQARSTTNRRPAARPMWPPPPRPPRPPIRGRVGGADARASSRGGFGSAGARHYFAPRARLAAVRVRPSLVSPGSRPLSPAEYRRRRARAPRALAEESAALAARADGTICCRRARRRPPRCSSIGSAWTPRRLAARRAAAPPRRARRASIVSPTSWPARAPPHALAAADASRARARSPRRRRARSATARTTRTGGGAASPPDATPLHLLEAMAYRRRPRSPRTPSPPPPL